MQKRQAVILSAEIQGIGSLDEHLPEAAIADFINEIHKLFETTLRFHHGQLKRFTGDTVLGVFYSNQTQSQAVLHALNAAFAIKEQLQALFSQKLPGQPAGLKMGIASGSIIETTIGSNESMQTAILGEAVTHAERICQFCGDDQVLTDQDIYEAAGEYYEFEKLEPIPLKGGMETLPIFEPLNKKHKKLDLKISPQRKIVSEMVGRSSEMEQLEGLIRNLAVGKGSIVNIVGKAGIGKSRLMAEMKVQPMMEKVQLLEGRALSTGQNLSYHPIIHLIRSWAGITEDDTPAKASEKLQIGIQNIATKQADEIYAFLATMMGLPLTGRHSDRVKGIEGESLEKLILKNLRDLIIAASKVKPRIYLVEDMHWSDASSIAMFESLYKLSLNHPVMFINVLRPGYKATGDYILKYLVDNFPGDHSTISVSSLKETDSGQLIANLLRKVRLPAETENMIIRKTEGNPFFIEEVIRSFIDEGIIEIHDNDFRVTEKIHEANIPETIHEVILSRVDKLDEKTRELLNTAAVMGRNFYYKVLEEAADTIGELDERLEYLKDVELISESEKKMDLEFLFKHALSQQATYESIVLNSKKELHLKIARSIEKVFAENLHEFYGTLVHHYEKAENTEKTEEYLDKAGDEAMRVGASSEAIQFFIRAIKCVQNKPQSRLEAEKIHAFEKKLVFAYAARGMNNEVIELTGRIMPRHNYSIRINKHNEKLVLLLLASRFMLMIRQYEWIKKRDPSEEEKFITNLVFIRGVSMTIVNPTIFLIEMFRYLLAYKKIDLSKTIYGSSQFVVSVTFFTWAGFAPEISEKVITLAKKLHRPGNDIAWIYIKTQEMIHNGLVGKWQPDAEQDHFLDVCLKKGEFFEATLYAVYRLYGEIELGNFNSANQLLNFLLDVAQKYENNTALAFAVRMKALIELKFRKMDLARETSREVMEFLERLDEGGIFFALYCTMAQLYTLSGNVNMAIEMLNKATASLPRMEKIKIWKTKYYLTKSMVYFELAKRDQEQNKSHWKICLQASKTAVQSAEKVAPKTTESNRARAMILWKYGNHKTALKSFEKAVTNGERLGAKLELSRTYFELGKFLSDPQVKFNELNGNPVSFFLEKSKSMFEEMDLQWDLEEYKKFISGQATP